MVCEVAFNCIHIILVIQTGNVGLQWIGWKSLWRGWQERKLNKLHQMCFSDKESHSEHYVKVGLGNKTSRGPGSPVESTLRISTQQRRTLPRASELQPCSPLLPFSRSLSSTGDQLPLPAGPHLCLCPIPTIWRYPGKDQSKSFHLQPSNHRSGSSSRPPQPSWPR